MNGASETPVWLALLVYSVPLLMTIFTPIQWLVNRSDTLRRERESSKNTVSTDVRVAELKKQLEEKDEEIDAMRLERKTILRLLARCEAELEALDDERETML